MVGTIYDKVCNIRQRFPFRGANAIRLNLCVLHGYHVSRYVVQYYHIILFDHCSMCLTLRNVISDLLNTVEPEAVQERHHHRLKRRRFWAAGVNDVWPFIGDFQGNVKTHLILSQLH
jgi:hypothetical protein